MAIADLITRFSSTGYDAVRRQLGDLANLGGKAESATAGLMKSVAGLAAGFLSAKAAISGVMALVETNRSFEKLKASLVTSTGSVENANVAWEQLMQYAMETPYGIEQVTSSFIKLVNYGLTPSKEALTSYGDTAASMSKSLDQMIEAVADAATGEFERLKEFGIKASKEGDKVTFTFRGVKTEVKNSAEAIERYLIDLGKTNFGGAMERQMATLDGAIANLDDTWQLFKYNMSDGTFADMAASAINGVTDALENLNDYLNGGEMSYHLDVAAISWSGWYNDIKVILDDIESGWTWLCNLIGTENKAAVNEIDVTWSALPSTIRAYLQVMVNELGTWVEKAAAAGAAVVDYLNPFSDVSDVNAAYEARIAAIDKESSAINDAIWKENEAVKEALRQRYKTFVEEQKKYKEHQSELKAQDNLSQFKVQGSGDSDTSDKKADKAAAARAKALAEQRKREFKALQKALLTEEQAIEASYLERNEIILRETEAGSDLQAKMMLRSEEIYAKEEMDRKARALSKVEQIRIDMLTEEDALKEKFERERKLILENTELTETQRTDLMRSLTMKYNEEQQLLSMQQMATLSTMVQGNLSIINQALADAGAESNAIYKMLFAAQKAAAIPSMIVATEQGATKALELGPIAGPVAAGVVRTMGYAGIATVAGTAIAGLFDQGGIIPAGKAGIVGEYGPEIVNGPAVVTSRRATMDKVNSAANQSGNSIGTYSPIMNFYINGTGVGDAQLRAMLRDAAQEGGYMGYQAVLADVSSRGDISRKIGR